MVNFVHTNMLPIPTNLLSKWRKLNRISKTLWIIGILIGTLGVFNLGIRLFTWDQIEGSSEWRNSNGQSYLMVDAADSYSLGYLTGQALASQIFQLWILLQIMGSSFDLPYSKLIKSSQEYLSLIPTDHILEMRGMAQGASHAWGIPLTFEDILVQNMWYDLLYGQALPRQGPLGCTLIGSNISRTEAVGGQNFDLNAFFSPTMAFVQHRIAAGPWIFGLRIGGSLNLPIACTSNQVYTFVSLVQINQIAEKTLPICSRTRMTLEIAVDAFDFCNIFYNQLGNRQSCGFNLLILDQYNVIATETAPDKINLDIQGQAVRTNTYLNSSWQSLLIDTQYSKDRQTLAENLLSNKSLDDEFTHSDLFTILQETPEICRTAPNRQSIGTLAFLTTKYFGLGNPLEKTSGVIPF